MSCSRKYGGMAEPLLEVRGLKHPVLPGGGLGARGGRRVLLPASGRNAGGGGGERLRQERHRALGDAAGAGSSGPRGGRRDPLRGPGSAGAARGGDAPRPRQPDRHGLPGADDVAQPRLHGGGADRRGACGCTSAWTAKQAKARAVEMLRQVGIPAPERAGGRVPAPALGRHAPAGDDRHGAGVRPGAAHRRRAHHRAGRHHPGADPGAAQAAAGRARHGGDAHHPRPGRGGGELRRGGGDVRGPRGGAGPGARAVRPARAPVHGGPAALHSRPCTTWRGRGAAGAAPEGHSRHGALRCAALPAGLPRSGDRCERALELCAQRGARRWSPSVDGQLAACHNPVPAP